MSNRISRYKKVEAIDEINENLIRNIANWLQEKTYMNELSELVFWNEIHEKFGFSFRLEFLDDYGHRSEEFGDLDKEIAKQLNEEED